MLSLFQDIFGGGTTNSTTTPTNMNPFTQSLGGATNNLGNTLAGGLPQYGGPTLNTNMSPLQNSLLSLLQGQNTNGGGAANTNNYLSNVLSGGAMPGSPGGNPFLSNAITAAQRTTMDNLQNTLSRSLPGYFTANGQNISPNNNGQGGSSAFDTAAALAYQSGANAMGDIASNISNNAWNTGVQQQTAAAGLSVQEVQNTVNSLQASALPQMIQQMGVQNGLQLYQENLSGVLNLLQTLGGITRPVVGSTTVSQGETTGGIIPGLAGLIGRGGGGGQSAGTAGRTG